MGRHHKMDQHQTEINEVLYRVHGNTGQRTWVDVPVVQEMDVLVHSLIVNGAVDKEKMEFAPNRDRKEPEGTIDGMRAPTHIGKIMIGQGPKQEDLILPYLRS